MSASYFLGYSVIAAASTDEMSFKIHVVISFRFIVAH